MYRLLVELLQPHVILLFLICWSLVHLWRRRGDPRRRLWPLLLPLGILAALSTPLAAHLALLTLESSYSPLEERPADAGAIVVFSGGLSAPEGPRTRAEMDSDSFQRCLQTERLYSGGLPCLVVVSGGQVEPGTPGPTCAAVMAEFLVQRGVKRADILTEEASSTTYENAVESAKLLKERDIRRVVLVVDAVDMVRAARCLRKQGIEVVPSPCHYRATRFRLSFFSFVPSPGGAAGFQRVWHEWVGVSWYWWRDRI